MGTMSKHAWMKKAAALSILPITALGMTACNGTSGSEEGADVEDVVEDEDPIGEGADIEDVPGVPDPYDGVYDRTFYDTVNQFYGSEVTLSADLNEVIDPTSFTIAGTEDTTVEALLVVHPEGTLDPDISPGTTIEVTGPVMEAFDVATVEEELGVDLDDALYEDWVGESYVNATSIEAADS